MQLAAQASSGSRLTEFGKVKLEYYRDTLPSFFTLPYGIRYLPSGCRLHEKVLHEDESTHGNVVTGQ